MKTPTIFEADKLLSDGAYRVEAEVNDKWVRARPKAKSCGWWHRIKCAAVAFTGRCDLVKWPEGQ